MYVREAGEYLHYYDSGSFARACPCSVHTTVIVFIFYNNKCISSSLNPSVTIPV